ncbi:hypothetical protein SLE2022_386070 [Rubroshorea leprosula]
MDDESKAVAITGKITVIAIIVLFLVVVFVLVLHLYAKWFWWRMEEPAPPRRRRRRFVFAPGQETSLSVRASKGLDSAVLASLPLLVFRQEDFKDGLECAVCLSELEEGEKARLLPKCNHGFHVDCIDMWFQSHSTCPICRNPVTGLERENTSSVDSLDGHPESPHESSSSSGHSTESPSFPTNILFWGNETQVSSVGACLEEGISTSTSTSSPSFASSSLPSVSSRPEGMLVIDVPMNLNESLTEGESKSPMPTRLRSLKRLLSRDKRVAPSSSSTGSVDV